MDPLLTCYLKNINIGSIIHILVPRVLQTLASRMARSRLRKEIFNLQAKSASFEVNGREYSSSRIFEFRIEILPVFLPEVTHSI